MLIIHSRKFLLMPSHFLAWYEISTSLHRLGTGLQFTQVLNIHFNSAALGGIVEIAK